MKGDFVEQITSSEFLKIKLGSLNVFPPPHKALFHDDFDANAAELVSMIKDKVPGIELVEARPRPQPRRRRSSRSAKPLPTFVSLP